MMTSDERSDRSSADFLQAPLTAVFWWGLPLIAGWSANLLSTTSQVESLVWATALAWMGLGCALNARRSHRPHCYLAAPVLFLGAGATAIVGIGWTPLGSHAASYAINGSLLIALLTFLAEPFWGRRRAR